MTKWLPLLIAWIIETATLTSFTMAPIKEMMPAYLLLHCAICMYFVASLKHTLPVAYKGESFKQKLFFLVISVFLPVIGMLGITIFVLPALFEKQHQKPNYLIIQSALLRRKDINDRQNYTRLQADALKHLLHGAGRVNQRIKAVKALHNICEPEATATLKTALRDKADDVRLLAYSILTQKEKQLQDAIVNKEHQLKQIQELQFQDQLLNKSDDNKHILSKNNQTAIHCWKTLANLYWQLVYQRLLLDQDTINNAETQALQYANSVLNLREDIDMYLLKGRIYLHQNVFQLAQKSFTHAVKAGANAALLHPYFLEIAFQQRNSVKINQWVNNSLKQSRPDYRLSLALDYWCTNNSTKQNIKKQGHTAR